VTPPGLRAQMRFVDGGKGNAMVVTIGFGKIPAYLQVEQMDFPLM
jgi:hypothetical protein